MPVNSRYNFLNSDAQLGEGAFAAGNALWGGPAPQAKPLEPSPATQFMNADMDLETKNQVLDFLRRDAMAKGMGANYGAHLGYEQEMMNTLAAKQPPAPAPAPVQRPVARPQPVVRRAPTPAPIQKPDVRGMQFPGVNADMSGYDMPARPEYETEQRAGAQGFTGLGSMDTLPLSDVSGPSMGEQAPEDFDTGSVSSMGVISHLAQQEPTPERPDLSAYEKTTLGKKALERGFDPRQLLVALAEFSAGMGNIKGQPMKSDARSFYQMQLKGEQEQRENDMKLDEMAMRYAPKPQKPVDLVKQELTRVQTDLARNKLQVEQELNDPTSERSLALKSALEAYVTASTGRKGFKAKPELTGADVYKWLSPVQYSIGQAGLAERTAAETTARQTARQDELDARAREQAAAAERAAADRASREKIAAAKLAAKGQAAPGKQPAGPGFKQSAELRKEYQNNPTTKATRDLMTQWGKVKEVMENPSAAGDMAGIFMFMKTLDPGSTVREGEYKSAAEATSALGRVQTALANARSGDKLNPAQRADFRNVMEKFYRAQLKQQSRVNSEYKSLAEKYGISPQDLMFVGEEKANIRSVNDLPDVR